MQLSTTLCSPILGRTHGYLFFGPFAPCISVHKVWVSRLSSKSLILEPCLLLGFNYLIESHFTRMRMLILRWCAIFLPRYEDITRWCAIFLPRYEDITRWILRWCAIFLPRYEDITRWCAIFLPQYEDIWTFAFVVLVSIILGLLIWQWSSSTVSTFIKQTLSLRVLGGLFPKLPHALNGVGTRDNVSKMVLSDVETMSSIASLSAIFDVADLLTMMALETLMFFPCEIVWSCQDAKEVSQALVDSALMAKELILLSFHIFSDSQVFTFTLRLGSVLNEIASVLHDVRSLATLFNPLSFGFIPCFDNVDLFLVKSLECMNVKNSMV
ncbi:hypothetical protein Bca52824_096745 [Brassica carinata]|uniref:Uncharacterized protein n=1 Tax=Brassica carinata TaxID=52824 RepID=A0A8X7NXD0_BRACI|nr:hypothetical protein Bca52824_096745 [Brassica carinata]